MCSTCVWTWGLLERDLWCSLEYSSYFSAAASCEGEGYTVQRRGRNWMNNTAMMLIKGPLTWGRLSKPLPVHTCTWIPMCATLCGLHPSPLINSSVCVKKPLQIAGKGTEIEEGGQGYSLPLQSQPFSAPCVAFMWCTVHNMHTISIHIIPFCILMWGKQNLFLTLPTSPIKTIKQWFCLYFTEIGEQIGDCCLSSTKTCEIKSHRHYFLLKHLYDRAEVLQWAFHRGSLQ